MTITQGAFSYLPDLTDDEIALQFGYALSNGWAVSVEFTDDPKPRNNYWAMWGLPMFGLQDPAGALQEINECRKAHPDHLYRAENERDYGGESIEILLQYMENHRDDLVVILAGYADRLAAGAGLLSKDDLIRLEPADFLASRVFSEGR